MADDLLGSGTLSLNFRKVFEAECQENDHFFKEDDDIRKRVYLLLSNSKDLAQKCFTLVEEFNIYSKAAMIPIKKRSMCLLSILVGKTEGMPFVQNEYGLRKLSSVSPEKLMRPPLFVNVILKCKTSIKQKITAGAYVETKGNAIGPQHIMYTTQPGSKSDSSSVDDPLVDSDSNSSISAKRRKTCQKAGDFKLAGHLYNSHFNNAVKCEVEIIILVGNEGYCKTLAKHLGLIHFESLLDGEDDVEKRLAGSDNKIYRLAHTGIIKMMMNGYSSICITASTDAWLLTSAHLKGIIYTNTDRQELELCLNEADCSIYVQDSDILGYIDAVGRIIQKSVLCNILLETTYEVAEKEYTKLHVPMTVIIPLYIVRYFSQSYITTYGSVSNTNPKDIFVLPGYLK